MCTAQLAMFGRKENVNQRPEQVCLSIFVSSPTYTKCYQARKMTNSTMVGTGFAMEGRKPSWIYNKAFSLLALLALLFLLLAIVLITV